MKSFHHKNADTITQAVAWLGEYKENARIIAGGTDLLGLLKTKVEPAYPEYLINIKNIPDMDYIQKDSKEIKIGALAKLSDIAETAEIKAEFPMLATAAESVAMPQIRHMGTIGGNLAQETRCWYYRYPHEIGGRILCRRKAKAPCLAIKGDNRYHALFGAKKCFAVCPSDTAIALAALDAQIQITGPGKKRLISMTEFYHPLGNALNSDEIITEIRIPRSKAGNRQIFLKHRVRESIDFAIVSLAVSADFNAGTCSNARVVLGAVAPGPYRAVKAESLLTGAALDERTAGKAANAAVEGAAPLSRNKYKIQIAKSMVETALLSFL